MNNKKRTIKNAFADMLNEESISNDQLCESLGVSSQTTLSKLKKYPSILTIAQIRALSLDCGIDFYYLIELILASDEISS